MNFSLRAMELRHEMYQNALSYYEIASVCIQQVYSENKKFERVREALKVV